MSEQETLISLEIPPEMSGIRVDKALSELLPEHSRTAIQQWIKKGLVLVDGEIIQQKLKLNGNESLEVSVPTAEPIHQPAQKIEFQIIDEDDQLMIINKPAGLVVHPGAGNQDGTLLNGLLHQNSELAILPRAGIVHRLDKNTTGLMVVAKTERCRQYLIDQLTTRKINREYLAVVNGVMISGETIDQPVGRHRNDRLRMTVTPAGKPATTHLRVLEKFRSHCLVQANLETGRTHQIRAHLSWRGYPIVGDKLYGNRYRPPSGAPEELIQSLQQFQRQALHARKLSLIHPESGEQRTWELPPPDDMNKLHKALKLDLESATGI